MESISLVWQVVRLIFRILQADWGQESCQRKALQSSDTLLAIESQAMLKLGFALCSILQTIPQHSPRDPECCFE